MEFIALYEIYQTFVVCICLVIEASSDTANERKKLTWAQISLRETLSLPTSPGSRQDVLRTDMCTNQTTHCRNTEYS